MNHFLQLHSHSFSECHAIEMKQKYNIFWEGYVLIGGNKANLNTAMITLLKVNLAHLQIVIAFYGHTVAGGQFICYQDIMLHPDCSFVSAQQ